METKKELEGVSEYIKRVVNPIFSKSLQETIKNQTLVGLAPKKNPKYILYNPHNYRLYFKFSKEKYNATKPRYKPKKGGLVVTTPSVINSKEFLYKDFLNKSTIRVKSKSIEIINKLNPEKWFKIDITQNGKAQLINIIKAKDRETKQILKEFIEMFGGSSDYKILNRHSDNKVKHEKIIDRIGIKATFQNEIVKKVYKENNIEFSDPSFVCNYITNQAIKEHSPEIAKEINKLATLIDPLKALKLSYKGIDDLIKDTNKRKLVGLLSKKERVEFETWILMEGN